MSSNGSAKPDLLGRQERANSVAVDTGILTGMPISHSADGTELNDKSQSPGMRFSGIEVSERRVLMSVVLSLLVASVGRFDFDLFLKLTKPGSPLDFTLDSKLLHNHRL